MDNWSEISHDRLRQHVIHSYRQGGGSRPDVLLIEVDGRKAVLKDHNACDQGFGKLLGPLLVSREAKALRWLDQIAGTPKLYATPDSRSLLMEHMPGDPLGQFGDNPAWEKFFIDFERLLREVHAKGVAHCDLRSPNNALICESNQPAIVDFVSCVFRGRRWNFISRWLFDQFSRADRSALIKLKKGVAPDLLTPEEERLLNEQTILERTARWLGASFRNLSRWLLTKSAK
jgi:predicted Ser/Thr protein kinase